MPLNEANKIIDAANQHLYQLTLMIVDMSPKNDEERQLLLALVAKRDELLKSIDKALDTGFIADVAKLQAASADIGAATKQLQHQKDMVDTVKLAISITAKVLDTIAKVIMTAMG